MKIGKGDKYISVPAWALVLGLLVADSMVANVCRTVTNSKLLKYGTKN